MIRKKLAFATASLTVAFFSVLLLVYEREVGETIHDTLSIFVCHVLPSLFPFMVLSRLTVSIGLLDPLSHVLCLHRPFRLPNSASSVILTGLLCGFPIGALGVCTLYENGELDDDDAGRLAALASNTGPAFLLGTVSSLWGSKSYGVFLYVLQLLSALIIAYVTVRITSGRVREVRHSTASSNERIQKGDRSFSTELCTAISESASACLAVCAYIVFFRTVTVLLGHIFSGTSFLSVLLELSSGCLEGARVGGTVGCFMTGFSVGAAGLSVMLQNYSFLGRYDLPMKYLLITKVLQGLFCGGASVLFYRIFPQLLNVGCAKDVFGEVTSGVSAPLSMLIALLLLSRLGSKRQYR